MRLLVVEDNERLAHLLTKGLQAAGYDTDLLTMAGEARTALTTTRYAALILDLGLPDGDGLSVLREIRHRKDPIPVLVLTARGGVHDRVSGLRGGADDYLVKPFVFEELLARLEALLRRPGQLLGRSLQKVSPQQPHALAQGVCFAALHAWAQLHDCGSVETEWEFRIAPPDETRRPLVPDVAYLSYACLPRDEQKKTGTDHRNDGAEKPNDAHTTQRSQAQS